jgi:tetratricopeptide (TPR) repeat protein
MLNQALADPCTPLADILTNLGQAYQALGHHREAETCLRLALGVGRRCGNKGWEGAALQNLATVASKTGRHADAICLYDQAIAAFHRTGDRYQETTALIDCGHAHIRSGQTDRARRRWRQARTIAEGTGDPRITTLSTLLQQPALAAAR